MPFLWIPVALYLLLYAPGHYLLSHEPVDGRTAGSRLFREVLLSSCCASWLGFVLAELAIYSLPTLLGLLAVLALGARARIRRSAGRRYRYVDLFGGAVLLLTWLWVAPPLDTRILGSDSAGYLASGVHLSRHGGFIIHDPTMPLLSADLKRALFPSVAPDRGSPPYLRLGGSLVLRSLDSDEVLSAFFHLIAVWIAVFHGLAGPQAAQWTITLFAGLSVWAMVEFSLTVGGTVVALLFFGLLLLLSPQYWYSRFLMPEVPGQYFLWGGLCCLSFWCGSQRWADAALAGLAFGLAGLTRIENAAFLLVAWTVVLWLTPRNARCHVSVVLGPAAALWLHAGMHLAIFRTHYFGNLASFLRASLAILTERSLWQVLLLCAGAAAFLVWRRRRTGDGVFRNSGYSILAATILCLAVWGDYRHGWSGFTLLTSYIGIPTVLGGGLGLLLCTRDLQRRGLAYQLLIVLTVIVFAQVMLEPHATPIPLWTVRRGVTVVLPALCFGLASLCHRAAQRWHWSVAAVVFILGVCGQTPPLQQLREGSYYGGAIRHVNAVATLIPPGSRLVFDSKLASSGFAPTLWAEWDLPAYLCDPRDLSRIRELATSLDGAPLYWLSNGRDAPPQGGGIMATPVALYEFVLSTPTNEIDPTSPTSVHWDYTVGLYSLRVRKPD